jgi:hypothetical protein
LNPRSRQGCFGCSQQDSLQTVMIPLNVAARKIHHI